MYVHLCIFIHMSVHICAHIFPICAASAGERAQQAVSCVNASPASSWGAGGKLFPSDHQSGSECFRKEFLFLGRLSSNGKRWWRHIAREFSLSVKETWLKARWLRSTFRSCCFSACGKKCNTCIFLPLFVLWCSCILCCQAIFHHMGPNMARGWEGDSAGTKVVKRFSKPFLVILTLKL